MSLAVDISYNRMARSYLILTYRRFMFDRRTSHWLKLTGKHFKVTT